MQDIAAKGRQILISDVIWPLTKKVSMALTAIELKKIDNTVGALCRKRSPAHLKEKLRLEYSVIGHYVLIYERRPRWNNPDEWIESGVAKLRYTRKTNQWQLYWRRANIKWVKYEPCPANKDLATIVDEVDKDRYGCFFG